MIVVVVAVGTWESQQGFPRGVGRVESRLLGFPCFPYPGISMACFLLGLSSYQAMLGFETTIILLWERDAGFY